MSSHWDLQLETTPDQRREREMLVGDHPALPGDILDQQQMDSLNLVSVAHGHGAGSAVDQRVADRRVTGVVETNWNNRLDRARLTTQGPSLPTSDSAPPATDRRDPPPSGGIAAPPGSVGLANEAPPPSYHNIDPTWVVGGLLALSVASLLV